MIFQENTCCPCTVQVLLEAKDRRYFTWKSLLPTLLKRHPYLDIVSKKTSPCTVADVSFNEMTCPMTYFRHKSNVSKFIPQKSATRACRNEMIPNWNIPNWNANLLLNSFLWSVENLHRIENKPRYCQFYISLCTLFRLRYVFYSMILHDMPFDISLKRGNELWGSIYSCLEAVYWFELVKPCKNK